MIHRFFGTKLNPVLIFLLLLAIGEFILQCRHITQKLTQTSARRKPLHPVALASRPTTRQSHYLHLTNAN